MWSCLTSRPRESASEDFLNRLLVLFGNPMFYHFGIVLPGWLVSFPFGGFLTGVMFVSWFLMVFLVLWFLIMMVLIVICCLVLLAVLVVLLRVGFWEASKDFDSTEKHQHTLHDVGTWRVFSLVPRFGRDLKKVSGTRWCSVCDSHVLHECHHSGDGSSLDDRVGVG